MNYKERVGLNINYYRKLADLTLKQVADRVGITEATMQKYEKGLIKRVDIEMIESIASAIGTNASNLTGWVDKKTEKILAEKEAELTAALAGIQRITDIPYAIKANNNNADTIEDVEAKITNLLHKYFKLRGCTPDEEERFTKFFSDCLDAPPELLIAVETLLTTSRPQP